MDRLAINEFFSILGNSNPVFTTKDNVNEKCQCDCQRYGELFFNSLKLRKEARFYTLNVSELLSDSHVALYLADYAVIDLRKSDFQHGRLLDDVGRSLINKATSNKFSFREIDKADHWQGIREILVSTDVRSGGKVKSEWYDENYKIPVWTNGLCEFHQERLFGIFDVDRIVAFCTVRFFGEVASFNFIMGHKEYLDRGVMNLLIFKLREYLRESRPDILYLHYMWMGRPQYANYYFFKKNTGFRDASFCIADDEKVARILERKYLEMLSLESVKSNKNTEKKIKSKLFKSKFENKLCANISTIQHNFCFSFLPEWWRGISDKDCALVADVIGRLCSNRSVGNIFCVVEAVGSGENGNVVFAAVPAEKFKSKIADLRSKISASTQRGDLLFLMINAELNVEHWDDKFVLNSFKGTDFQMLSFQPFYGGGVFVLARL